jgi:hypothetical protein
VDKEDYKEASVEVKNKILAFWHWTYENKDFVRVQLDEELYGQFLSSLVRLTIVLNEVKDGEKFKTKSWLLECAPYVNKHFNDTFLIEYLLKFTAPEDLKNIAEIFIKMLNSGITPMFKKEDIQVLVDRIYNVDKNSAIAIIEIYSRRGQYFLKPIWEKHQ